MGKVIRREDMEGQCRFSFADLERQGRDVVAQAEARARRIVGEAEARARQLAAASQRKAHEAGLAEGRRVGMAQVEAEARQAAREAAQANLTQLIQALSAGLAEFDREKRRLLAVAESGLLEVALAIAERVCKLHVQDSVESARGNIRAVLDMVRHHGDLELHVNPAEHALLASETAALFEGVAKLEHVHLVADPAVTRGGCVLYGAGGVIDATLETQLEHVAEALCGTERVLSRAAGDGGSAS